MKSKITIIHCVCLGCLLLGFNSVFAENGTVYEEEVVVTATRTEATQLEAPGMTEVISKDEIEKSGTTTVAELLDKEGFTVSSYGGTTGIATIRFDGGDPDQTLVLINGVPANSGTMSVVDLSLFPTTGISRIEVSHGPLSSLYGSNASGGVINIITDLTGEPVNFYKMTYGNADHVNADSKEAVITVQQPKYGFVLGGNSNKGFRDNSATDRYFLMYQYDFIQKNDESLSLFVQSVAKDGGLPGTVQAPTPKDKQNDRIHAMTLTGKKYLMSGLWEFKTYSDYWKETSFTGGIDYEYNYHNYGVDAAGLYLLGNHEILFGTTFLSSDTDSTLYGEHQLENAGIFAQDSWSLGEQWKLISGLRWDTGSEYSSPVCPKISLVYLANNEFSLKFGYGKSFRAPTISDLYLSSGGNPDLDPEIGERYDITGEWRKNIHSVSINIYQSHMKDGIDWIWVGPGEWDWAVQNFDKINANGLNLNWRMKWNDNFNSNLKYSWVDKENWDQTSQVYKEDNFFGKNKLAVGLNYQNANFRSSLNWEYVWDRADQMDYSTYSLKKMDDYNVVKWNLTYIYNEMLNYNFSISNLTNQDYAIYYGYPMTEREYKLSVNYSF